MTDIDIVAELRRLGEKAPPGKWEACGDPGWVDIWGNDGDLYHLDYIEGDDTELSSLIVAMHNHLPALLDAVEALRGLRRYPANTVSAEVYEMRLDAALAALKRSDEE